VKSVGDNRQTYYKTVGHTGLARLCLVRWYYRTRTKPVGGGGCHEKEINSDMFHFAGM